MIDLDYNATTPVKPPVREAMVPFLEEWYGNPSSVHQIGQRARAAVEDARDYIANSVGADPESFVLTGSGSEANTLALRGWLRPPYRNRTLVTTAVEHSSVLDTSRWMEAQGATVRYAPVTSGAQLDIAWFEDHVGPEVDLVSVMHVNNETGVVHPIREIGRLCQRRGVVFHVDAIQAYGKLPVDFASLPVNMLSLSAHKVGGPKGVGALVAPKSLDLDPLVFGGHQERDRRGGTENVPAVVGFGEAARRVDPASFKATGALRDETENRLLEALDRIHVVGRSSERVPNTSGLLLGGVEGEDVVMRLDMEGIAAATGAACTSGSSQPSHVIKAVPFEHDLRASSFLRLSFPPDAPRPWGDQVVEVVTNTVRALRDPPSRQDFTEQYRAIRASR